MRTATANLDFLPRSSAAAAGLSQLNSHGVSLLGALDALYSAVVGHAYPANLPAYLVSDAFGEQAARPVDSHVRDGFGRSIY